MNRLIDKARDAAWMLAEYVVMNEANVEVSSRQMMGDEVARVIARGSITMPTDMMLGLANLLNALQVIAQDQFDMLVSQAQRSQPTYVYDVDGYGPSLASLVRPFQRRHDEACASALALGLQMVFVSHCGYDLIEKALAVNEKLAEVVRTNEALCEQIVRLKAESEDFLTMRDDAFRGRKDAEAENVALRGQVKEWKRKYEAKVYHNE